MPQRAYSLSARIARPGPGRQRQVDARARLDAGLLVRAEHVLVLAQGLPSQVRWYRSRTRPPLRAKYGSRGKIHDRCCQGLIASSASQRRTVDAETDATMPAAAAWRASSGQVQRASGFPLAAGGSQARALTSATTRAGNVRGRPGRGASASPARPCWQYRRRHLRAVSSQMPSRAAIALFPNPSAASSTIRARSTSRNGAVARRDTASSSARAASSRQITYGLAGTAISSLPAAGPAASALASMMKPPR